MVGSAGSSTNPQDSITISELLEQQSNLESQAAEVIPFDVSRCTRSLGSIRQSVYSCLTCNPPVLTDHPNALLLQASSQSRSRAGFCSACSVSCHADHQLVELFVRRKFSCECGTKNCNPGHCQLAGSEQEQRNLATDQINTNRYDHNFDGQFCICERGKHYDPETETEDMYQCLCCEDWRHASCLGPHPDTELWDDLICAECVRTNEVILKVLLKHGGGEGTGMIVSQLSDSTNSSPIHLGLIAQPPSEEDAKSGDGARASSIGVSSPDPTCPPPQKRSLSDHPLDSTRPDVKRPRMGSPSLSQSKCRAPYPNSDGPLSRLGPNFTNVFLMAGWRMRWCRCEECFQSLKQIEWLLDEEEDVWEPEPDEDSAKSLHELGLEALQNLPREQMIEGLYAYNRLRDEMMNFLKPFEASGQTVTEQAIKEFFANARQKVIDKTL